MRYGRPLLPPVLIMFAALGCQPQQPSDTAAAFLEHHWKRPLSPQGAPPPTASELEASLDPAACGTCHIQQYRDWKTTRHAKTTGAGLLWQLPLFGQHEGNRCLDCHAPLAEQKALVADALNWPARPAAAAPSYVPKDLHFKGLVCAACHLRNHTRYGPPSRKGLKGTEAHLPHDGFVAHRAFEDSLFCASCHQFPEDGPRLGGKLREDTYNQWLRSPAAAEGKTCQSCHMPDRRHVWRGITDPKMLRSALAVDLRVVPGEAGGQWLEVELQNVGAGHHLPTYLVPRIDVNVALLTPEGRRWGTLLEHQIQWRADVHLRTEMADTRLAAGERRRLKAALPAEVGPGWRAAVTLDVAPKEHYERVYRDMLRQASKLPPETLTLLRQALEEAESSRYQLELTNQPLFPS